MALRKLRCAIEQLADWHPRLFLEPHAVACAAVLNQYSNSPAVLDVDCENIVSRWLGKATGFRMELSWLPETAEKADRLRSTVQTRPLVEMAAVALGLILAHHVVPLGQLDVTAYGERADYRSLSVPAVLEMSGTESLLELNPRHRDKAAQAAANPFGWDAYVVVCAFLAEGHRVRFSKHRSERSSHV